MHDLPPLIFALMLTLSVGAFAQPIPDGVDPGESARTPSGQPWTGTLQQGGEILVDPRTNRPVVRRSGYESQLWDGVYRLSDGTELHVRDGRVVPTTDMLQRRSETPTPELDSTGPPVGREGDALTSAVAGQDPCKDLVNRACGPKDGCAKTTKCSAARQLEAMAEEQRGVSGDASALRDIRGKCNEALRDDFFTPCVQTATGSTAPETDRPGGVN